MNKKLVLILIVICLLSVMLSACKDNPVDTTNKVLSPLDTVVQQVEKMVDDTCTPQNSWADSCNNMP